MSNGEVIFKSRFSVGFHVKLQGQRTKHTVLSANRVTDGMP